MSFSPIPDYEGLYEISHSGQVRSLDRTVLGKDGTIYPFKGRLLRPTRNASADYLQVSLWKNGVGTSHYVHRLVGLVHIPNPLNLPEINHLDGNRQNCHIDNLEWVTSSGNSFHAVEMGLRTYTNRLTKDEFVACLFDIIAGESYSSLSKRVPYKVPFLSTKLRKLAKELGIEHELDQSIQQQRKGRARINGSKNRPAD